jgi:23S rRNA-/tRNA-specific pseudouridylate synthase
MLFAKNEEVKRILQENWKEMVIDRAYVAVVEGKVDKSEGEIRSWLKETKTKLMYTSLQSGEGLEAISHYKVLRSSMLTRCSRSAWQQAVRIRSAFRCKNRA